MAKIFTPDGPFENLNFIVSYCSSTVHYSFLATEQCDWPEQSLCQFDPDGVKAKVLPERTYLYLTFDDGPNEGTNYILDALAAHDVPATFFINRYTHRPANSVIIKGSLNATAFVKVSGN